LQPASIPVGCLCPDPFSVCRGRQQAPRIIAFITPMNRSATIDSPLSLDASEVVGDTAGMNTTDTEILLYRRDPARNMARFYSLAIEPDLFGHCLAVRRWGRIGTSGRCQSTACISTEAAVALNERQARSKRRRGYVDQSEGALLPLLRNWQ